MAKIKGKWTLKNPVTPYGNSLQHVESVSFRVGGDVYGQTYFNSIMIIGDNITAAVWFNSYEICSASGAWSTWMLYQSNWDGTMDFGEEPQYVSDDFYYWFINNAIPVYVALIVYNNEIKARIESGQTGATLKFSGQKAVSNIEVHPMLDCYIVYNNTKTKILANTIATLSCAGKTIPADVVISIGNP